MLWKVGVYSRLSERLIGYGRDRAFRPVVSDTDTPKILTKEQRIIKIAGYFFVPLQVVIKYSNGIK